MKHKLMFSSLLLLALFLALAPTAIASTTWYVNGVNGSDSHNCKYPKTACKTIGHAISLASSGDTIRVGPATYFENLTITFSLNVIGFGARTTVVDGGGGGFSSVVEIDPTTTATVVLSGLTIRNGSAHNGAGIYKSKGTLTINSSTVSGNVATLLCGFKPPTCFGGSGGGIFSDEGTLTINNSTVSGNGAEAPTSCFYCYAGYGGGIVYSGTLTINNSTVSGNTVFGKSIRYPVPSTPTGGGIYYSHGTLTINNSTISGNSAYRAGGIENYQGKVTLRNSIVANNGGGNCSGTMTSNGYNLSSDNTCNFNITGDLNNTDPMLGTLQYNGGPTQTMALPLGSPAIDAGNPKGCTDGAGHLLTTDQRGYPRHDSGDTSGCDMGAFERQSD